MKAKKGKEEQEQRIWEENLFHRMEQEVQKMREKKEDEWQKNMDSLRSEAEDIKK